MQDLRATDRTVGQIHILAWHFLPTDQLLTHGDGRRVEVGQTSRLTDPRPVSLSHHGLHASERILDALRLAPGPVLCRVELCEDVQRHGDILVARERRVLWMQDISPLLHRFAVHCARQALEVLDHVPDRRLSAGLGAKESWLLGEVDDAHMLEAWEQSFAAAESCRGALDWAVVQTVCQASSPHDAVNSAWQTCQESIQVDLLRSDPSESRDTHLAQRSNLLESLVAASYPEATAPVSSETPRHTPWTSP